MIISLFCFLPIFLLGQTQQAPLIAKIGTNVAKYRTLSLGTIYYSFDAPTDGVCALNMSRNLNVEHSSPFIENSTGTSINFTVVKGINLFAITNNIIRRPDTSFTLSFRPVIQGEISTNPIAIASSNSQLAQTNITYYSSTVPAHSMISFSNSVNINSFICTSSFSVYGDSYYIEKEGTYIFEVYNKVLDNISSFTETITSVTATGQTIETAIPMTTGTNTVSALPTGKIWYKYVSNNISNINLSFCNLPIQVNIGQFRLLNQSVNQNFSFPDSCEKTFQYTDPGDTLYVCLIVNKYENFNFLLSSTSIDEGHSCVTAKPASIGSNSISFNNQWFVYTAPQDGAIAFSYNNLVFPYTNFYSADYNCSLTEYQYNESNKTVYPCKQGQKFYISANVLDTSFTISQLNSAPLGSSSNLAPVVEGTNKASFQYSFHYQYSFTPTTDKLVVMPLFPDSLSLSQSPDMFQCKVSGTDPTKGYFIANAGVSYTIDAYSYRYSTGSWDFHSENLPDSLKKEQIESTTNYILNDVYKTLNAERVSIGHIGLMIGDVCSRQAEVGGDISILGKDLPDLQQIMLFKTTADNYTIRNLWVNTYIGINYANVVIKQCNESTLLPVSFKNQLLGEAYFLRALQYFYLLNFFGEIPIPTEPFIGENVPFYSSLYNPDNPFPEFSFSSKASKDVVWKLIEQDLQKASNYLPLRNRYNHLDIWRASKGAAQALLCKSYIFQQKWQQAKNTADSVIQSAQYALTADYHTIFTHEAALNSEKIFEINDSLFGSYNLRTIDRNIRYVQSTQYNFLGYQLDCPSNLLVNKYQVKSSTGIIGSWAKGVTFSDWDPRLDLIAKQGDSIYLNNTWYRDSINNVYQFTTRKSEEINAYATQGSTINIPLIRYSDLLLWHAEASMHLGDQTTALDDVNSIRTRARNSHHVANGSGGYNLVAGTLPSNYTSITLNDIYLERDLELSMEGHGFFDLVRTGRDSTILAIDTLDAIGRTIAYKTGVNEIFPIPYSTIFNSNDSLKQNNGYYTPQAKILAIANPLQDETVPSGEQILVFDMSNVFTINGQAFIPDDDIICIVDYKFVYAEYFAGKLFVEINAAATGILSIPYSISDSIHTISDTLKITLDPTLKIASPIVSKQSNVCVYPNPCKEYINIVLFVKEKTIVELIDLTGRVLFRNETVKDETINTSNLSAGMYIVKIITADSTFTKNVIVE